MQQTSNHTISVSSRKILKKNEKVKVVLFREEQFVY